MAPRQFGPEMKKRRERIGLTLRDMARVIGCSASALCRWERENRVPGAYFLARAEKILGCRPGALAKRLKPQKGRSMEDDRFRWDKVEDPRGQREPVDPDLLLEEQHIREEEKVQRWKERDL